MNLLKIESYGKGIVISSLFNIFAKSIAFINNIVIAYYFGTQVKTDIYFYLLASITILIGFVSNLNYSVLIPESMRIKEQESSEKSIYFLNFFLYLYLFLGLVFVVGLYINPVKTFTIISSFDKVSLSHNIELLYFAIPLTLLMLVTGYLSDILTSYKYFTIPMIAATINSCLSLIFVAFFHHILDLKSVLIGLIVGYVLNLIVLISLLKFQLNWNFDFKFLPIRKLTLRNILYAQSGHITSTFSSYLPFYFLSGFGSGILTSLNFGRNLSELPNQFITSQFSSVVGIKFNELFAKGNFSEINRLFISILKLLMFLLIPISLLLFLYSSNIITLLYKRGAFNEESVFLASNFLRFFALTIPFAAYNMLFSRLFMSSQRIKNGLVLQIMQNFLFIIGLYVFLKNFGYIGYPISFLISNFLNIIMGIILLKNMFPFIEFSSSLNYILKICLLNGISFGIVMVFNYLLPSRSNFFLMLTGGIIYSIFIVLGNIVFKLNNDINVQLSNIYYKLKNFNR